MKEAPESVVLAAQHEIYRLKDSLPEKEKAIEEARKLLKQCEGDFKYTIRCIKEHAAFLQEQCPDAVKHGTWFDEFGVEDDRTEAL